MGRKNGNRAPRPPVGKSAFHAEFALLSHSITVGQDNPETREIAQAISRARHWANSGDYLAAIHAISGIELRLQGHLGNARAVSAGDVEQSLGDLRREIEGVGEADGSIEAASLWQAAREEVIRGSWEAALALIEEAHAWLKPKP